jgi:hypothetical protein
VWSSRVKRKGTTQVMYIAKLKDGPKRAKKTLSMILERVFEMVWWRGRKWNQIKKDLWSWSVFLLSKYRLPFYLRRLLRTWGFWWYWSRKSLLQKPLFKWHDMEWHGHVYGYTGGGHIFWNGVMHANIAKPWLWRCEGWGHIGSGRIFRSGGMHTNISGWG